MGVGIAIQLKFSGEWEWELSRFLDQLFIFMALQSISKS